MNNEKNLVNWLSRNGYTFEKYNEGQIKGVYVNLKNIYLEIATDGDTLVLIESPEDCGKQYSNRELYKRIRELKEI